MEGCKSSNVIEIETSILHLDALKHIRMAWVNSCDDKWAKKVVKAKPNLCIVEYLPDLMQYSNNVNYLNFQ